MLQRVLKILTLGILFCSVPKIQAQLLLPVLQNGSWGYVDEAGNPAIAPQFDKAGSMEFGVAKATKGNSLFIIFSKNKILELPGCSRMDVLQPGALYKVQKNKKWFMADTNGNFISDEGFDRIWAVNGASGVYYFTNQGKTGLIDSSGAVLMQSEYSNLKQISRGFYVVQTAKRISILLSEKGIPVVKDSFRILQSVCNTNSIFYGLNTSGKFKIFSASGEVIASGPRVKFEYLNNDFVAIFENKVPRLFDAKRMLFIDSVKGVFSPSIMPASVSVTDKKAITSTFNRHKGIIIPGLKIESVALGIYSIIIVNGMYGLLSEDNDILLQPVYGSIVKLSERYFSTMDSGFMYRLYDAQSGSWTGKNLYTRIISGDGYFKAFGLGNSMDLIRLKENGDIKEINTYFNVTRVEIIYRTQNNQIWDNTGWNANTPAVLFSGNRNSNWFSTQSNSMGRNRTWTQRFGLRSYDSVNNNFDVYLQPLYQQIRVLSTPDLSIAGLMSPKVKKIPVANRKNTFVEMDYTLVRESTGKPLMRYVDYIDAGDCESNSNFFRVSQGGKMVLISKRTLKPVFAGTYASRETNGIRRVCLTGALTAETHSTLNNALVDRDYLNALGLTTERVIAGYSIRNADWRVFLRNGKLLKPEIAGSNKITFISEFWYGYAIVVLSNGKCGVIDTLGDTHIPANYDHVRFSPDFAGHFYCGINSHKYGLANQYGEFISPPTYSSIQTLGDIYYAKIKDSVFLLSPGDRAVAINKGTRALKFEGETGFIKSRFGYQITRDMGETVENGNYQNIRPFNNGYAAASRAGLWGLVDCDGNTIVKHKYSNAREFGFTTALFEQRTKWFFVDLEGKKIPRPKGADAHKEIAPGIFVYEKKNKFGIFDAEGKKITSFRFGECPVYFNEFILASKNNKVYFFSPQGVKDGYLPAVPRQKNRQFTHERAGKGKVEGYDGFHVIQFAPAQLKAFGLDTPWNKLDIPLAINTGGELQKDYLFEAYQNDVYLVKRFNIYSFLNGNDEALVNTTFSYAQPMYKGLSVCKVAGGNYGVLDNKGFWILPPEYSDIKRLNDSIFSYRVAYEYDVYDDKGNKITEEKADALQYRNGILTLRQESKIGYYKPGSGMIWELQE